MNNVGNQEFDKSEVKDLDKELDRKRVSHDKDTLEAIFEAEKKELERRLPKLTENDLPLKIYFTEENVGTSNSVKIATKGLRPLYSSEHLNPKNALNLSERFYDFLNKNYRCESIDVQNLIKD